MSPTAGSEQQEALALTQELIRIATPNPPGRVRECAELVAAHLAAAGLETELAIGEGEVVNVVGSLDLGGDGPTLVLNGHLDVVPAGEGWSVDPFEAEYRDGLIYGRGAADMKGGLAAMILALGRLARRRGSLAGRVVFLGAGDEETGSLQGTAFLVGQGYARNADFAIVAEPTNLEVEVGNRGLRWLEIEIQGCAGHASRPHLGANAISHGARVVAALENMVFDLRNDLFEEPVPTLAVTMIQAGTKINVIPDRCLLAIDRRTLPGEDTDTVVGQVEAVLATVADERFRTSVRALPVRWSAFALAPEQPVVQALQAARRQVLGRPSRLQAKSACTDASYLYEQGIPAALFGPGDACWAHAADERIPLSQVVDGARVLVEAATLLLRR